MTSVFSATPSMSPQERPPQLVELQLLPAEELMSLWEQTQRAAWMMEEKGVEAGAPMHYGHMVVWELQRRLSLRPDLRFSQPESVADLMAHADASAPMPHIMTLHM